MSTHVTDVILYNGNIATQDEQHSMAEAVAIGGGRVQVVGNERDVMRHRTPQTRLIDLGKRTVIPGLNDSHTHVIRGGLN